MQNLLLLIFVIWGICFGQNMRPHGFCLDVGIFGTMNSSQNNYGAHDDIVRSEIGLSQALSYHFLTYHTAGIWADAGIGDETQIGFLSHFSGGIQYLFGKRKISWTVGTALGVGTEGITAGITASLRHWFLRLCIQRKTEQNSRGTRIHSGYLLATGYSFFK